jgi:hypothetical protein
MNSFQNGHIKMKLSPEFWLSGSFSYWTPNFFTTRVNKISGTKLCLLENCISSIFQGHIFSHVRPFYE